MSNLMEQFTKEMELKGFANSTQKAYLMHVRVFANHYQKTPESMGEIEIKDYLYSMLKQKKSKQVIWNTGLWGIEVFLFQHIKERLGQL